MILPAFSTRLFRLASPAALLLLASCAAVPPAPPGGLGWEAHRQAVLALDSWTLEGRLNIRGEASNDTISLHWEQHPLDYEINLSGRLGLGAVRISGDGAGVLLEKAGEEPVRAPSLQAVSAEYLGYVFPVEQLHYWIRGVDAPGANEELTLDAEQRLASLAQDGWRLQYDRYQEADGVVLPGRIRMDFNQYGTPYRLTFLISRWELADPDQAGGK